MKKQLLILALLLLNITFVKSQCPTINLEITTQEEIDNFSINYPNCTNLDYEIKIVGSGNLITNLNGFSEIVEAESIFLINTDITSLYGLHNIETMSSLAIWGHNDLQNLTGLTSVFEIGHLEIWVNSGITSLEGIDNLQTIGNLNLFSNPNLSDISQLNFLTSLSNGLTINGNGLSNFIGLQNLVSIGGDVAIANENIQNFSELNNLQAIGGSIYLQDIHEIEHLAAFDNITEINDFYIINCSNLENFWGLENLTTVNGTLRIGFNQNIRDLSFIKNIVSVKYLDIYENENLETLQGIESIKYIEERLFIDNNPNLTSIKALNYMEIPSEVNEVVIINNESLSVCRNEFICSIIEDENISKGFFNNAEGCNTIEEVQEMCDLSFSEIYIEDLVSVYPNPASDYIIIQLDDSIQLKNAQVFSATGRLLLNTDNNSINLNGLNSGIYSLRINTENGIIFRKIVKE